MQSFVVLGIIPGTNVQITFNFWLTVSVLYAVFLSRHRLFALRRFTQRQLAAYRIARAINRCDYNLLAI